LTAVLLNRLTRTEQPSKRNAIEEKVASLTDREREVIRWLAKGLKNSDIAEQMAISESTVRHHFTSIFRKLGMNNRVELLLFAESADVQGFYVYRGRSPEGPFERIIPEMIPARADAENRLRYKVIDTAIEPGVAYYYVLEEVKLSGETERKSLDGPAFVTQSPWMCMACEPRFARARALTFKRRCTFSRYRGHSRC